MSTQSQCNCKCKTCTYHKPETEKKTVWQYALQEMKDLEEQEKQEKYQQRKDPKTDDPFFPVELTTGRDFYEKLCEYQGKEAKPHVPEGIAPRYYWETGFEAIDIIEYVIDGLDANSSFLLGNVIKYVLRAGLKEEDPLKDLLKANNYAYRLVTGEWKY